MYIKRSGNIYDGQVITLTRFPIYVFYYGNNAGAPYNWVRSYDKDTDIFTLVTWYQYQGNCYWTDKATLKLFCCGYSTGTSSVSSVSIVSMYIV